MPQEKNDLPTLDLSRGTLRSLLSLLQEGIWIIKIKNPFFPEKREVKAYRDAHETQAHFDPSEIIEKSLQILGDPWAFSFLGEIELYKIGESLAEVRFYRVESGVAPLAGEGKADIRLPLARLRIPRPEIAKLLSSEERS